MERLSNVNVKCIQLKTGSCNGCPVQEIAISKISMAEEGERPGIVNRINKRLCPKGTIMQLPTRQKQSVW